LDFEKPQKKPVMAEAKLKISPNKDKGLEGLKSPDKAETG